jgi:hypothetical protein
MHSESFIPEDEEITQPIVQWYPHTGPLTAVSPGVVAVASLALGVLATLTLFAIGRRAFGNHRLGALEVDELTVRRLNVLDD